jgi:hypothetical protein
MIDALLDFFQRNWVLSILVLLVFGYILGLSITATVDQRLRDAVIQMPTPKQTIIVNMNSKKTNEFFEGGKSSTSSDVSLSTKDKSSEESSENPASKGKKKASIQIVDKIEDHPVYENFMGKRNKSDDEFIPASTYAPKSYKDIPDVTQRAYAISYKIAESLSKVPFPFKAYNHDESLQHFTKFNKNPKA